MVLLQHPCYLITFILAKSQASLIFSQPQDTIKNLDPGFALILERDPIDFTTNSEPADLFAVQPDSDTPSDEKPNDITFDQPLLQGDNLLSPGQSTLISASVPGAEINKQSADNSQDSALLPGDGSDGVPNLIPNVPSLSLPSLPNVNQVFENIIKGGTQPEEPNCDEGLFSFCCELGPPKARIKKGTSAEKIAQNEAERRQRLRGCVKWNKDHPACQFPENEACCQCLSLKHYAFYCYNPHWRANPDYNGMPQPPPHPISNPDPNPDLAPTEPIPDPSSEKRGLGEDDDSDSYYAPRRRRPSANPPARPIPPEESWRRPGGGPPRAEYMCSNEFLESVGVAPVRPQWTPKFTPDNPWQRKPPERKKKPQERKKPGRKPITPPADEPEPNP